MNFLEGMRHFGNRKLQGKEDNNMMNFAVVVVTYNRLELLKECLECIRNQELVPNNVVIVDNNSTDGTGKYLNGVKEIIEHQWMVKHEEQNIGGAGGFHDGLKLAMETDSEWFLLIDDDAMIAPNYLSLIAESIEKHPSILAYSGTVVTENNIMIEHRRRFKKAEVPVPIEEYKQADFEYDLCSFCGAVINRKVVNQIGYPERDFFIWYDDTEYSLRIMNVSKFLNVNNAILNHKTKIVDATSGNNVTRFNWKTYYGYRNIIYSDRKHHMLWVGIRYHLARWLRAGISDFLNPSIDKEISKYNLQLIIDAIHDGLVGHLGINKDYRP